MGKAPRAGQGSQVLRVSSGPRKVQTNFPYLALQKVPAVQEYWLKNAEMPTPGDGSVMQRPCCITAQAALSNSVTLTAYLEGKSGISWEV